MDTERLSRIATRITELEAERASNLAAFMGTKGKNGAPWSGVGITNAYRLSAALAQNPGNSALWRQCLDRVNRLTAG